MVPYYISFFTFAAIAIFIKIWIIVPYANSFINLVIIGIAVLIPLMVGYFLSLFFLTTGMKYFVARKPIIYNVINKFNI